MHEFDHENVAQAAVELDESEVFLPAAPELETPPPTPAVAVLCAQDALSKTHKLFEVQGGDKPVMHVNAVDESSAASAYRKHFGLEDLKHGCKCKGV